MAAAPDPPPGFDAYAPPQMAARLEQFCVAKAPLPLLPQLEPSPPGDSSDAVFA